jgi:hypothetical protein
MGRSRAPEWEDMIGGLMTNAHDHARCGTTVSIDTSQSCIRSAARVSRLAKRKNGFAIYVTTTDADPVATLSA